MNDAHLRLARRIADGTRVDWDQETSASLRQQLKQLAEINDSFRQTESHQNETGNQQQAVLFDWGHLQVLEEIGAGAYGQVYRAFDTVLEREVALKLRAEDTPSMRSWHYIEEARRLARVRHPNVLAVHGADVHNGRVGLWADLVEGQTLPRDEPIEPHRLVDLGIELVDALNAVHHSGLIHGDVKPQNIMIDRNSRVVLMDFGAGRNQDKETDGHICFGTPLYMAPELFQNQQPTPASDIYALGVLFYHLLSTSYPVLRKTPMALMAAHARGEILRARQLKQGCAPLRHLIDQCLSPKPNERPTALAVGQRLRWIKELPSRRAKRNLVAGFVTVLVLGTLTSLIGFVNARSAAAMAAIAEQNTRIGQEFLLDMLQSPAPSKKGRDVKVVDLLHEARRQAGTRFARQPHFRASVLKTLGRTYQRLGDLRTAQGLLEESLALTSPENPKYWAEANFLLAENYLSQNKVRAAEPMLQASLTIFLEELGEAHLLSAEAACLLGRTMRNAGRLEEATELLTRVIGWQGGKPCEQTSLALLELGEIQLVLARYAEALPYFRHAYQYYATSHGEHHPNTLRSRASLTTALTRSGRLSEAELLMNESLTFYRGVYGPEHLETIRLQLNFSALLQEYGRSSEALQLLEPALAGLTKQFGEQHLSTQMGICNKANLLRDLGNAKAAEDLQRRSIAVLTEFAGEEHLQTMLMEINLAELLSETGRFEEGGALAQKTWEKHKRILGERHHHSLEARDMMAVSQLYAGRYAKAVAISEEVLTAKRQELGAHSQYLLTTLDYLARACLGQEDLTRAQQLRREALQICEKTFGKDHPKTRAAQKALTSLLRKDTRGEG